MTSYNLLAAAAKKENEAFFARLGKVTTSKEGISLEEYINNCLILHEIIGVDPVYPQLSKANRENIKQNATVEYERNGIDYDGVGRDRQVLAVNAFDGLEAEAHIGRLESIQIPTVVLHGLYDSLIPVEMGRQLASKIPGCRIVEYVGNHCIGNHPDVFNFIVNTITDHISRYSKK
jgi:pimeloyl-ACP methyl ester carboxylesterase